MSIHARTMILGSILRSFKGYVFRIKLEFVITDLHEANVVINPKIGSSNEKEAFAPRWDNCINIKLMLYFQSYGLWYPHTHNETQRRHSFKSVFCRLIAFYSMWLWLRSRGIIRWYPNDNRSSCTLFFVAGESPPCAYHTGEQAGYVGFFLWQPEAGYRPIDNTNRVTRLYKSSLLSSLSPWYHSLLQYITAFMTVLYKLNNILELTSTRNRAHNKFTRRRPKAKSLLLMSSRIPKLVYGSILYLRC